MSREDADWPIARLLQWTTEDFTRRGLDTPRLDAEILLAHVLGIDRVQLIIARDRVLVASELSLFRRAVERRRRAEPVAYIVGHREFYGIDLHVDARVLVPRPDTETLVETALKRTRHRDLFGHCLDLCTGSGCVAIAFAKARPTWAITATDVSAQALEVARANVLQQGTAHTVTCLEGDLFQAVPGASLFELITANPPYIPSGEIAGLPLDIQSHEPRLALDGGHSGLELIERIINEAPRFLVQGGILALELGAGQYDRVAPCFERAGFRQVSAAKDYAGWQRVISGAWE